MESPKASQSSLSSLSTSSSHCSSTGSCLWHLGPRDLYHGWIRGFSHAHRAPFLSCFGPRDIVRAAPEITLKSPEIAPDDFWSFCSRTCWGQRGQNQRLLSAQFQSHPGPRASWPGLQVPAAASPEPATVPELCHGSQLQSLSEIPGMTAWVTLMPAGVQVAPFQSSSLPSF